MPERIIPATPRMLACMAQMKAAIDPQLEPVEMLALVSQLVGNLIALQDWRSMTSDRAILIVTRNIEAGNQEAMRGVATAGGVANL